MHSVGSSPYIAVSAMQQSQSSLRGPLSAPSTVQSSSLSNSILKIVRSQLPRLAGSRLYDSSSESEYISHSRRSSGNSTVVAGTPASVYRPKMSTCSSDREFDSSDDAEVIRPPSRNTFSAEYAFGRTFAEYAETESGIQWKYATQGKLEASQWSVGLAEHDYRSQFARVLRPRVPVDEFRLEERYSHFDSPIVHAQCNIHTPRSPHVAHK